VKDDEAVEIVHQGVGARLVEPLVEAHAALHDDPSSSRLHDGAQLAGRRDHDDVVADLARDAEDPLEQLAREGLSILRRERRCEAGLRGLEATVRNDDPRGHAGEHIAVPARPIRRGP
jgi:hypothetical protein